LIFHPGRMAFSHDGNQYDHDDWAAAGWDFAILWAFGMAGTLVHMDYGDNLGEGNPNIGQMVTTCTEGPRRFPGIDSTKIFNDMTNLDDAIANFAEQAGKGSEGDTLVFVCAGPMEVPWRCLNAVDKDKLQYVKVISHDLGWNDNHTSSQMTHTFKSMQSSFPEATFIHISDQNANLGGGSNWSFLNSMPEVGGLDPSAWQWLKSRDQKNGDVSDCGMTWFIMTGNQNARPADFERRFKNPLEPPVSVITPLVRERTNEGIVSRLSGLGRYYSPDGRVVGSQVRSAAGVYFLQSTTGITKITREAPKH